MAQASGQQAAARLVDPEEVLTYIITLASSVDGVDAVVGVHEGFTYTVHSSNPEYEVYADEIAAATVDILRASRGRIVGDENTARVVVSEYREKALLVADLGHDFTVAIVGEKNVVAALAAPVERIVSKNPLTCPKCGAVLDIHSYTCPGCGRRIPFTSAICPWCGEYTPVRNCPGCGTPLRLSVSRVEPAEAERREAKPAAAAPAAAAAAKTGGLSAGAAGLIGAAVTAAYYSVAYAAGMDAATATLAGAPALVTTWLLLFMSRKR